VIFSTGINKETAPDVVVGRKAGCFKRQRKQNRNKH